MHAFHWTCLNLFKKWARWVSTQKIKRLFHDPSCNTCMNEMVLPFKSMSLPFNAEMAKKEDFLGKKVNNWQILSLNRQMQILKITSLTRQGRKQAWTNNSIDKNYTISDHFSMTKKIKMVHYFIWTVFDGLWSSLILI